MKDGKFILDGPKAAIITDENIGGLFDVALHIKEEGGYYYATGY
jgi:iron complex transport system ATP-binding protein